MLTKSPGQRHTFATAAFIDQERGKKHMEKDNSAHGLARTENKINLLQPPRHRIYSSDLGLHWYFMPFCIKKCTKKLSVVSLLNGTFIFPTVSEVRFKFDQSPRVRTDLIFLCLLGCQKRRGDVIKL